MITIAQPFGDCAGTGSRGLLPIDIDLTDVPDQSWPSCEACTRIWKRPDALVRGGGNPRAYRLTLVVGRGGERTGAAREAFPPAPSLGSRKIHDRGPRQVCGFSFCTWTSALRAVRWRMLFVASSPSRMVICQTGCGSLCLCLSVESSWQPPEPAEQHRIQRAMRDANKHWILHLPAQIWGTPFFVRFLILTTCIRFVTGEHKRVETACA